MPVYVIQAGEGGPCKIGHAKNVDRRLATMQTATHERLRLIAVYEGGQPEEAALHKQFAEARLSGEWFRLNPEEALKAIGLARTELPSPARKSASQLPQPQVDRRPYLIALMDDRGLKPVSSRPIGRGVQAIELYGGGFRFVGPDGRPPFKLIRLSNAVAGLGGDEVGVDLLVRPGDRCRSDAGRAYWQSIARSYVRRPMGRAA